MVLLPVLTESALQPENSNCAPAAPPGNIIGHASSDQFLRLAHSAQLLHIAQGRVAVAAADASFPSQYYLTTALVHLYSLQASSRENLRYCALLALFA